VTLTITAAQRDALSEQILIRLSAIDSISLAATKGDIEKAEQLAREHCDYLHLMLDDLGFGASSGTPVELNSPPDLLRRAIENLRELAVNQSKTEEKERSEAEKLAAETTLVLETCDSVLSALDAG
jgi:hypothetical protein